MDERGLKDNGVFVVERCGTSHGHIVWSCICFCGNKFEMTGKALRKNKNPNCGCSNGTHRLSNTRIYQTWYSMKGRCENKDDKDYEIYGGSGIKVCKEWSDDFMSFYNWSMENGYKDDLTIDRIDNDKGYDPNNCRYVNYTIQNRNRSNTVILEHEGVSKPLAEWCEIYNIPYRRTYERMKKGWSSQEILLAPKGYKQGKRSR